MATIDESLTGLSVAILGPGKVGLSLGSWLQQAGAEVRWVASRTSESTTAAANQLNAEPERPDQLAGYPWDLLLVSVPDAAVTDCAQSLAGSASDNNRRGGVALHTSGSLGAEALHPLRGLGVRVGSLHPLLGFPAIRSEPPAGIVYGFDGDPEACELARSVANAFGGQALPVAAEKRLLYHYCATLAAGGVSTLLSLVDELSDELDLAGFRDGFLRLSQAVLTAAEDAPDAAATITGPIARGDFSLADRQLFQAQARLPDAADFLRSLHRETRRQTLRELLSKVVY